MKQQALAGYDVLTVGETPGTSPAQASELTNEESGVLSMVFQFEHMGLDGGESKWQVKPWSLLELKQVMTRWQKGLEGRGWNSVYLTNHDQPRALSRFGDDGVYRVESAKLLATFTHLLQGTPYIYQGEELGMTNVAFPSIDDYRDIETLNMYREVVDERGGDPQAVLGHHPRQEPRQRPHAGAVGRQPARRLHQRHALDQGQPQLHGHQRPAGAGRPRLRSSTTTAG